MSAPGTPSSGYTGSVHLHVGDRVVCPCYWCNAPSDRCRHARQCGTVTRVGRRLAIVHLDEDALPVRWRERGFSDRVSYGIHRLSVLG